MSDEPIDIKKTDERFPSNSYTNIKLNEKKVVTGEGTDIQEPPKKPKVKIKPVKRSITQRIADNFLNIDKDRVKDHLLFDWLFPEIISTVEGLLRMCFFGSSEHIGRSRSGGRRERPYNSIFDERRQERERSDPTKQNFRHIKMTFYTREDADYVIGELRESLEESSCGYVTVKELYSLADMPTNYTMTKWGWYDLEDAMVTRYRDDYILEMPRAEVIE